MVEAQSEVKLWGDKKSKKHYGTRGQPFFDATKETYERPTEGFLTASVWQTLFFTQTTSRTSSRWSKQSKNSRKHMSTAQFQVASTKLHVQSW